MIKKESTVSQEDISKNSDIEKETIEEVSQENVTTEATMDTTSEVKEDKKLEKPEKTEVLDHKCPSCGGKLDFKPKLGKWKCNYCGNEYTMDELQKYNNASSEQNNVSFEEENVDNYQDYISYTCKDCGAEIVADKETTATFCVYCGNTAILKNKLSGKFEPSMIIPFKKEKSDAEEAFKALAKGRPLVPKTFTDEKNIEKIRGIYIPFWFHNFEIEGELDFSGHTYDYWSVGDTDYTRTNNYMIQREGKAEFKSVPVDGSTRFDDDLMNTIQPYDYKELVPYNHAYLSGFLAERFDVESEKTRPSLEKSTLEDCKNLFLESAPKYSGKVIKSNTLHTANYSVKYVLLPVYMVNVKYLGKMYTFAMNGQTGEFIGNIPVDRKKAWCIAICLFVGLFVLFLAATYFAYLFGGNA